MQNSNLYWKGIIETVTDSKFESLLEMKKTNEFSIWSYKVKGKRYYIKISKEFSYDHIAWILTELEKKFVKTPRILRYGKINNLYYFISSSIEGRALKKVDLKIKNHEYFKIGIDLAKINSTPLKKFGWVNLKESMGKKSFYGSDESFDSIFEIAICEGIEVFKELHICSNKQGSKIKSFLKDQYKNIQISTGFLIHNDFNPAHIYIHKGKYSGIIDFGSSISSDYTFDIANYLIFGGIGYKFIFNGWIYQMKLLNFPIDQDIITRVKFMSYIVCLYKATWYKTKICMPQRLLKYFELMLEIIN